MAEVPTIPLWAREKPAEPGFQLLLHLRQPHKEKEILGVFVLQQEPMQLKSQPGNRLCKALNPLQPK